MTRFTIAVVVAAAAGTLAPAQGTAQQRIDRFDAGSLAEAAPIQPGRASLDGRSSYWLEGAAIGLVAGVATALLAVEAEDCPLAIGSSCSQSSAPVVVGTVVLGTAGAVVGAMLGASIAREPGP